MSHLVGLSHLPLGLSQLREFARLHFVKQLTVDTSVELRLDFSRVVAVSEVVVNCWSIWDVVELHVEEACQGFVASVLHSRLNLLRSETGWCGRLETVQNLRGRVGHLSVTEHGLTL